MSISYHGCAISKGNSPLTATMPAVTDGDVLLMTVSIQRPSFPSITTPTGWTLLATTDGGSLNTPYSALYWRVASSEPGSYSITFVGNSGNISQVTIVSLTGADTTQPVAAQFAAQYNASSVSCVSPALGSWSSANGIDVNLSYGLETVGANSWTPPTNYTEPSGGDA